MQEGKGALTDEQKAAVAGLVARGVTKGTWKGYESHWNKWVGFLQKISEWQRPDKFLADVATTSGKVGWLSLFVLHLYDVHGFRDSQRVSSVLSGLRLIWRVHGLDSSFFDEFDLQAAKRGVMPTVAEVRNAELRKSETRKLPAVVEVLVAMRERLWVDTAWDAEGSYRKAI